MTNPSIASDLIERGLTGKLNCPSLEPTLSERPLSSKEWRAFGIEAAEALSQLTREVDDILDEADFLCARLRELENELSDDHTARQFYGHVAPSLARMEALSRSSGGAQ